MIEPADIGRLRRMVELAEAKGEGDEPRTQRLRGELAEMLAADVAKRKASAKDAVFAAEAEDEQFLSGLPFSPRINRRLQDHGVFDVEQLSAWTYRLLGKLFGWQDILAIRSVLGATGQPHIVGSSDILLHELPPKNQYAVDMRQGVFPEEARAVTRKIAFGELTFREASVELGSRELAAEYGLPHQRAGSRVDRALQYEECAQDWLDAFIHERAKHGWDWCQQASLEKLPVKKRPWGLRLVVGCPVADAVKTLGASRLQKTVGAFSWRGVRLSLVAS